MIYDDKFKSLITRRARQLKQEGFSYKQIALACEREGLLKEYRPTWTTIRNWLQHKHPNEFMGTPNYQIVKIKDKHKEEIKLIFTKHLEDMGFTPSEIKAELRKLIK